MSTAATAPTPLLVERRFPLELKHSIQSIRALYESGKDARWTPAKDIAWDAFAPDTVPQAARDAARQVWSRRAWLEYTGLAETPALLIRFCLEAGRESDPKYFLTVRNTEEAWHIECFHRYAKLLGGYLDRPADARWEDVLNRTLYRDALDASQPLDTYVAVHCAVEDGLDLALYRLYAGNAREPVVAQILARVLADKERHAAFGWLYLAERAARMDAAARAAVATQIEAWLRHVAFTGYHIPSLSSSIDTAADDAAATLAAEAGLGAATPAQERASFRQYLADARTRLGELGIVLPVLRHPSLGEV